MPDQDDERIAQEFLAKLKGGEFDGRIPLELNKLSMAQLDLVVDALLKPPPPDLDDQCR